MAFDIKEFITKKEGPLPVWGWVLVGAGGFLIYKKFLAGKGSPQSTAIISPQPLPAGGGGSSGGSTGGSVGGLTCGPGTVPDPTGTFCIPKTIIPDLPNPATGPGVPPVTAGPAATGASLPDNFSLFGPTGAGGAPQAAYTGSPGYAYSSLGGPPTANVDLIQRLQAQGMNSQQIAEFIGAAPSAGQKWTPYPSPIGTTSSSNQTYNDLLAARAGNRI